MRLADTIGRWLGRVEVVLAGADDDLREGEQALARGDAMAARAAARAILEQVPGSPLGLALLADACEMAGLDAELALTLEELATRVARADVLVRLGRARQTTGAPLADVREAYVRALSVAEPGSEARREALLLLADLDIAQRDGARADLWLDRAASDKAPDVVLRRAEARLASGDVAGARVWLSRLEEAPTDARAAMARGRAAALSGDPQAFTPLVRAMVLDAPGASEMLSSAVAWIPSDEATRARVLGVVEAKGEVGLARWRAAFARAEGRRDEARTALRDALASGDASAARPLLEAALDDRDYASLTAATDALALASEARAGSTVRDARRIPPPESLGDPTRTAALLDALAAVTSERVRPWAEACRTAATRAWVPAGSPARWDELLTRLDAHARALRDLDAMQKLAAIATERPRPVRIAIVGEFNAGKSTFINALMGADIAPTGVLPTTATLHHLRYAPDPIARILLVPLPGPPSASRPVERLVPVGDLRATLKSTPPESVRRVEILLPIVSLTRVEILDTPGFNAPEARHTEVARAAFEEADAAIWLLDAGQAFKQTEREILEEARAVKLPIQILVNKADRVAETDLPKVMEMVNASLVELGFTSWSAPLALSARLALKGRLGDGAALAASGWERVQKLLEEQLVARSAELKERALRRRTSLVVAQLAARAIALAGRDEHAAAARSARAQRVSRAAATLERDLDAAVERIATSLAEPGRAWKHDLAVVVTGRDAEAAANDPVLARYRIDRALARLATPLAEALTHAVPDAEVPAAELAPTVRAAVRAFAAASDAASIASLARATATSLVEHLGSLAAKELDRELDNDAGGGPVLADGNEPDAHYLAAPALARELGAFAEALQ